MNTVHINRLKAGHFKRQRQHFDIDYWLQREAGRLMVEDRGVSASAQASKPVNFTGANSEAENTAGAGAIQKPDRMNASALTF